MESGSLRRAKQDKKKKKKTTTGIIKVQNKGHEMLQDFRA